MAEAEPRFQGPPAEAVRLAADILRQTERGPADLREAAVKLATLLSLPKVAPVARGGFARWRKRKLEQYLDARLDRRLTLSELAAHVGLSVSYFCRAFKVTFGDTPRAYITRMRVRRAQELMLATADPLNQIALACGFESHSQLSKLFRRWMGEPPSVWRRRNLTEAPVEASNRDSATLPGPLLGNGPPPPLRGDG